MQSLVILVVALLWTVKGLPLETDNDAIQTHNVWKRFVNPMFALGGPPDSGVNKMRTKRGAEDECEKLTLCKLHARSHSSFFAAFELYFVNKNNARLWDHHGRTLQDCERMYGDCYEEE